jgi:NADPH:quinone reductase-like Zn-dependent oxidoreductase
MRALALTGTGGLEHLLLADVPVPEVRSPHEVRVRVQAAALNRLDLLVAHGLPGVAYQFPHVTGSDGAGVVDAVGTAVTRFAAGDRVMINPGVSCGTCAACARGDEPLCDAFQILGEHRPGTIAEYVVVPDANLAPVPDGMSWPQAAAFSLATLTAWRMLVTRARVAAGEVVLVWGAGGGVAQAAIQVARRVGAQVIATSADPAKLLLAELLGAAHGIDHHREDVVTEVRRLTANRGADVVVDTVGEPTWARSLRALRRGGRLVTCGATGGPMVGIDVRRLFWHQWSLLGSTMGSHAEYQAVVGEAQAGRLWPRVDLVVPLEQAARAFERLQSGAQAGKVVIDTSRDLRA